MDSVTCVLELEVAKHHDHGHRQFQENVCVRIA